jgi:hypothetical protein
MAAFAPEPVLAGLGLPPAAAAAALELFVGLPATEHDGVEDAAQVRAAAVSLTTTRAAATLRLLSRRLAHPAVRRADAATRALQADRLRLALVAFVATSLEASSSAQANAGGSAVSLSLILQRTGVTCVPSAHPAGRLSGASGWRRTGVPPAPSCVCRLPTLASHSSPPRQPCGLLPPPLALRHAAGRAAARALWAEPGGAPAGTPCPASRSYTFPAPHPASPAAAPPRCCR